ncbi:MAG: hypothetical protein HOO91_12910 [Bacteroidales bacterium]|nr:hypothetical protein [Bacteroidales bacterium]NOU18450.1 hypothetical protein [Bacteroidales bacterium]
MKNRSVYMYTLIASILFIIAGAATKVMYERKYSTIFLIAGLIGIIFSIIQLIRNR